MFGTPVHLQCTHFSGILHVSLAILKLVGCQAMQPWRKTYHAAQKHGLTRYVRRVVAGGGINGSVAVYTLPLLAVMLCLAKSKLSSKSNLCSDGRVSFVERLEQVH